MKKFILVVIVGFLTLTSCDNFLTEAPKDEISTNQLLESPETVSGLVNGLYREGRAADFYNSGYGGADAMFGGYMSGFFDNEAKGERIQGQVAQDLTLDPEILNQFFDGWWSGHYEAIAHANLALDAIPDLEGFSSSEKSRLLAEARFFRALNYYNLVTSFGDVPLLTEPVEGLEGIEVSRTSSSEVYAQIVADLNWAVNQGGLADVPFPLNNYRITRGAAASLLADVRLTMAGYPMQDQGSYAEAASAARTVINSGNYSLVEHGADPMTESAYEKIRTSDVDNEFIYGIEYDGDISSNDFPGQIIPGDVRPAGITFGRTFNVYRPIEEFTWMYDPNEDLRIQEKQLFYSSLTVDGTVYEFNEWAPYLWYEGDVAFESGQSGDRDLRMYRYSEVLLIAAEAIARSEGVTAEAVGYLADVRDRAYWQTDRADIVASLNGLSVQDFVEEVWKERLRELALNFKIWNDIQRTRKYPVPSQANPGEVTFVDVVGASNNWGQTYQEKHLLFPIPDDEIQTNPALEQNPGYN